MLYIVLTLYGVIQVINEKCQPKADNHSPYNARSQGQSDPWFNKFCRYLRFVDFTNIIRVHFLNQFRLFHALKQLFIERIVSF